MLHSASERTTPSTRPFPRRHNPPDSCTNLSLEPIKTMERELNVGISLERTSDSIGSRWRERLFAAPGSDDAARALVEDLLRALAEERHCLRLLRSALGYGQACIMEGRPSSTLLHRLDVLEDTLLEASVARPESDDRMDRLNAPRVRSRIRLVRLSATTGFSRAACAERLRAARQLRHDIRNPLGTVRNALEMVAERSTGGDHRLEDMASRNLRAVERMIRERVSDTSSLGPEHGVATAQLGAMCEQAEAIVRDTVGTWPFGSPLISGSWGERIHEPSAVLLTATVMLALALDSTGPASLQVASSVSDGALCLELRAAQQMSPPLQTEDFWRLTTELAERLGARIDTPAESGAIRVRLSAWGAELPHDVGGSNERAHL